MDDKNPGTFDKLVSSISESERKILLEKMHSLAGDPTTQELQSEDTGLDEHVSFNERIKSESLFYRFILWLRAIFKNLTQEEIYNQDQIADLAKKLDRSYPGLIDYKGGYLLSIFYQKLKELKTAIDFFKPYLNYAYDNIGAFYVFLGSLVCPEVTKEMDENVDPFLLPLTREVTGELRSSYLRKMEEILKNIPAQARSYIYVCVTSIEWFYQLLKLPYERFLNLFGQGISDSNSCKFESCSNEFARFARILCNGGRIPEEAITSLYLFSSDKIIPVNSEATDDDGRLKEYMDKAAANISMIHMFIKTVPMRQIGKIVYNNIQWVPENFSGAEDWFVKYKDKWKKMFEDKWEQWLRDKKKAFINSHLQSVFGLDEFPLLPHRPWTSMWEGIPFHFEYTTGFIFWFMSTIYSDAVAPLKILLLEGAFDNKDNRQEFANTLNDIMQIHNDIIQLDENLSKNGQIGIVFDKIAANHLRTLQAQSKIETTMLNVESTALNVKKSFCNDCRSIVKIVDAALGNKSDTRYDGVSNISRLKGMGKDSFKTELKKAEDYFKEALDLIKELEQVDLPENK